MEIHKGICRSHLAGMSVALKAVWLGYYWPMMKQEALQFVQSCDKCQRFTKVQRQPSIKQKPILSLWPFDQWGIDFLGPFPIVPNQSKICGDHCRLFYKMGQSRIPSYINVKQRPKIRMETHHMQVTWNFILISFKLYTNTSPTRFSLPTTLISDNEKHFSSQNFMQFCLSLGIKQ